MDDRELNQLVDRNDPIRRLIDYNLQGLTALYFVREKQGKIGMVRSLLERQLRLGRIIKGLNFIDDEENEVTEIVLQAKHTNAFIAENETVRQKNLKNNTRKIILGEHIENCNPYVPVWSTHKEMSPQQRANRTAHHVRRLVNQWYQCAQKSKNETIQSYYQEKVRRVKSHDVHLWKNLVYNIDIEYYMQTAPTIFNDAQAEQYAGAQKRKARGNLGPVGQTLNSAERKPKEIRQRTATTPNHNSAPTHAAQDNVGGPSNIMEDIENMGCADLEDEETPFVEAGSTVATSKTPAEPNTTRDEHHTSTMAEQQAADGERRKPLKPITVVEGGNNNVRNDPMDNRKVEIKIKNEQPSKVTGYSAEGNKENNIESC